MAFGLKLFSMFGEIVVDAKKALGGLDKINNKSKKVFKMFGNLVKGVAKFTAIGATIGLAAVAGLSKIATKAAETTDRIDKLSQKLGLSRTKFQEWDFILSQSGASIDSLKPGLKKLAIAVDELREGTGIGAEAFERLGLGLEDLQGLSQEEIFEKTIVALQEMDDEALKVTLTNDLLGRSGQEMAVVLNLDAEAIERMRDEAHELGLVLSDEAIDAGVQYTDTMDKLKRSLGTVFTTVGTNLIPIFEKMAQWVINNMPKIQRIASKVFGTIWEVIQVVWDIFDRRLLPIFRELFGWIQENMPKIKNTTSETFRKIKEFIEKAYDFLDEYWIPLLKALFKWVVENMPLFKEIFNKVFTKVKEVVKDVWLWFEEYLLPILKSIFEWVMDNMPLFKEIFKAVFKLIKTVVENVWKIFKTYFLPILEKIFKWIQKNMPQIKKTMTTVFQIIQAVIEAVVVIVQAFYDILVVVFDYAKGVFQKIGGWIKSAFDGVTDFIQKVVDVITNIIDKIKKVTDAVKNFFGEAADEEDKYISNSTLGAGNFGDIAGKYAPSQRGATVSETAGYSKSSSTTVNIYNNNNPDADTVSRQVKRASEIQALDM